MHYIRTHVPVFVPTVRHPLTWVWRAGCREQREGIGRSEVLVCGRRTWTSMKREEMGKRAALRETGKTRALGSSREDSIITLGFEASGTNDPMEPAAGPQFAGKGEAAGDGATRTSARLLDSCQAGPSPPWCP